MISEFDLILPGKLDENIRSFNIETECLTYLYTRLYIPNKETGKPWKIIVHIVPKIKEATCYMVLGTINVEVEGNIDNYFLANDKDKKVLKKLNNVRVENQNGFVSKLQLTFKPILNLY